MSNWLIVCFAHTSSPLIRANWESRESVSIPFGSVEEEERHKLHFQWITNSYYLHLEVLLFRIFGCMLRNRVKSDREIGNRSNSNSRKMAIVKQNSCVSEMERPKINIELDDRLKPHVLVMFRRWCRETEKKWDHYPLLVNRWIWHGSLFMLFYILEIRMNNICPFRLHHQVEAFFCQRVSLLLSKRTCISKAIWNHESTETFHSILQAKCFIFSANITTCNVFSRETRSGNHRPVFPMASSSFGICSNRMLNTRNLTKLGKQFVHLSERNTPAEIIIILLLFALLLE